MNLFTVSGLQFDVGARTILKGLDLNIAAGTLTALVGRNGCGKSTLIKHLSGQIRAQQGAVHYRGACLSTWQARALARDLAYLPQTTPAAEGVTLEELVALGRYPWRGALGRMRAQDHDAVAQAIARCGLESLRERLVDTLSGGERQRAWIAMMLAQGARSLLLDEPISALDVAHQVEVLGLLADMCRNHGYSVVVVLHDVNMAARYCDHVVALKSGQVALQGPIDTLMTPDALAQVYDLPMQVHHGAHQPFALPTHRTGGRHVA
ncbi:ABC transporter ATP-binding protein [Roseinatronobacter sp. S2]|uniref:ABC transporter ATP-binding protein n=1 Tax=Roseinatronobacter sp. S2 TaxID=3035471 RepID=UPI00240F2B2E|nr:ABC transporter ATP-binding protein [Roseinatronobacter sp. S2]WFE77094.1 ABC transporter ATP-binding protein [Roseinatronobacter sp. S2]